MDKNRFKKECMGIMNQLFDLAEVPVEKRQAINDIADEYVQKQFLRLFDACTHNEGRRSDPLGRSFYCEGCASFVREG